MNADKLTMCPCGKSDACYVTEVNEKIKNYFCYGCGFQSNSLMKEGEPIMEEQEEILKVIKNELLWNVEEFHLGAITAFDCIQQIKEKVKEL